MKNPVENKRCEREKLSSVKNLTILYINDDITFKNSDLELLQRFFTKVVYTDKIENIVEFVSSHDPHIIITDLKIAKKSSLKFIDKIKQINPFLPIMIKTTKKVKKKHFTKAFNIHVDSFLSKPISNDEFIEKVLYFGEKYFLKKRNIKKRKVLQSILDNQSGLVLLTDFENISFCSKSFLDFYSINHPDDIFYRYESLLDMFIPHENYLHAKSKEEFLDKFNSAFAIDKVVLIVGKDFTPKAFHIDINMVEKGDEPLYIITLTNISIIQERNIEISNRIYTDSLTGINNRVKFEETFEYELKKAKRYNNPLCVAMLDIDYFKKFNDTYGHLTGDEILIAIANIVDTNIRETDLFARWGGEEFVLLMPEISLEKAYILCEKLREIISSVEHPTAGKVTASFGITALKKNESDLNVILKRCDIALYNAKANGRNRTEIEE